MSVPWIFFGARLMRSFRRTVRTAAIITGANRIAVSGTGGAGCKRNCTRQIRENTCDDVSSTLGVLTVIGNWFQSAGCTITFGLIPCPDPPRCWWD